MIQLYTQKTRWWFLQKPPTISWHPLPHVCGSAVGCAVRTATTTIPTQQAGVFSGNRSNLPYMTYNCNGCCFNLSEKASKHPKFPSPHFFLHKLGFHEAMFRSNRPLLWYTPQQANMAPKQWRFGRWISFSNRWFSGPVLIFGRVALLKWEGIGGFPL